ncbi:hypothetical protein N9L39_02295 [Flavobacteriaceae bacterium]|nr:hypothetical protein [Flavobacteriaceae bacterium]
MLDTAASYDLVEVSEANLPVLAKELLSALKDKVGQHMVIDFSNVLALEIDQISDYQVLLPFFVAAKKSIVLVVPQFNLTEIDSPLSLSPTILEAEDLIQMEEIERDLGF